MALKRDAAETAGSWWALRSERSEVVHYRNITRNPHIVVHLGEGAVEIEKPTNEMARRLSDESFAKYPKYGRLEPSLYREACRSCGRVAYSRGRLSTRTQRASRSSSQADAQGAAKTEW
ncbi:MAG: hypothetical protein M3343_04260 [Actinomycetota bacterium]|nr:hypothetical protein [Actinomycetota bacterium]